MQLGASTPPINQNPAEAAADRCVTDIDDGSNSGPCDADITIDDLLDFLARFAAGCSSLRPETAISASQYGRCAARPVLRAIRSLTITLWTTFTIDTL